MSEERKWTEEQLEIATGAIEYTLCRLVVCWNALSAGAHPERLPELLRLLDRHCNPTDVRDVPLRNAWDALGIDPEKLKETP